MNIAFIILLIFILAFFYFNHHYQSNLKSHNENFNSECWIYGDDYNSCYSDLNCTVGFLPDGSTHCMKKFLQEDI